MQFVSTRGTEHVSLDSALVRGIADDGGLFVPVELPQFSISDFDGAESLAEVAAVLPIRSISPDAHAAIKPPM